jgi:hypothetical protein
MSLEVSALMGTADEDIWEREGLFNIVDNLCRGLGGDKHLNDSLTHVVNASQLPSTTPTKVTAKATLVVGYSHSVSQSGDGLRVEFSRREPNNGVDFTGFRLGSVNLQGELKEDNLPVAFALQILKCEGYVEE